MSVSKDPNKITVEVLSGMPENQAFPSFHSSMAGGNTITEKDPYFGGRGSRSEATHMVMAHELHDFGDITDTPVLAAESESKEAELNTDEKGSGYTPTPRAWKEL